MKIFSSVKTHYFSLLELILTIGILALFLLVAAETLVGTLEIKQELEYQYGHQKVKDTGWNILYQDLGFAVGIYYHHVSLWEGPPKPEPKEVKTADQKLKEKKEKKGVRSTSDELFIFDSLPSLDDPFMEIVVAKGRIRSAEEEFGFGFRKVKYYLIPNPNPDVPGEVLMRSEEKWIAGGGEGSRSLESEEEVNLQTDYRRYALIENLSNVAFDVYTGKEWEEEWSSLKKGDLPLALRISYDLLDEVEPLEDQTRIIPIPISYLVVEEPEEEF
jgi:hypothetical protein